MHLQLGEVSAVVISSREAAKEIMKTNDLAFVQRPKLLSPTLVLYDCPDIAFAQYGDYWREMRKICIQHMLSAKNVKAFSSIRDDEIAKCIHSIKSMLGKPIHFADLITSMVSAITTRASLGNQKGRDAYVALAKESVSLVSSFNAVDAFPSMKFLHGLDPKKAKLMKLYEKLDKVLNDIIEHRRNNNTIQEASTGYLGSNLVDALLELQHTNNLKIPLTTNNIKAVIWDILVAGIDTPSLLLTWAMLELMANPKVMQKLQSELRKTLKGNTVINEEDIEKVGYLRLVTKEVLRLHPPAAILPLRECQEACEIGGYKIPKKTNIIINAWSLGRDPEYWHNADAFLPEGFIDNSIDFRGHDFEYIPFGAGRRICPGMSFGLAIIEFPLAQLLYHFNWELPEGVKVKDRHGSSF